MKTKQINVFIYFILLAIVAGSSACSLTRINAQSRQKEANQVSVNKTNSDSAEPSYQPPKRVSKDIIKKDEKTSPAKTK